MSDGREPYEAQDWRFNFNTAAALAFAAFGVWLVLIIPEQVEQQPLIFGRRMIALDPALFPNIVAAGFIGIGLLLAYRSLWLREPNDLRTTPWSALLNVAVTVIVLAAYAALMQRVGFVPTSIAVIFVLGVFYGSRNLPLLAAVAVGVPLAIFHVFSRFLQVYLPPVNWPW